MLTKFYLFITSKTLKAQLATIAINVAVIVLVFLVAYWLGAKWYIIVAIGAVYLSMFIFIAWRGELKAKLTRRGKRSKIAQDLTAKSDDEKKVIPSHEAEEYSEATRPRSLDDTVAVPIVKEAVEPDENTLHTQRNNLGWLFMIRHIWKRTLVLLVTVPLSGWLIFGIGVVTHTWATEVYLFGLFAVMLLYIFDFKREKFRKQHTECYVRGDSLIYEYPDSFWYGFGGGQSSLMIDRIDTVDVDPRKWLRKIFWRKLRNMTINAPGEHDKVFNNLIDLTNADEIKAAINARKYSINH